MGEAEADFARLRLIRSPRISPVTYRQLIARFGDTAAHVGAIGGGTVGVTASGIDIAFPPENRELQKRVASEGLLIAEQPPGSEPLARHFPSRNRIIAGLAQGTVAVEAAPRSGARIAAEAGREVMAVPGSPLDPRAQGCNLLIREARRWCRASRIFSRRSVRSIHGRCARRRAASTAGQRLILVTPSGAGSRGCSVGAGAGR